MAGQIQNAIGRIIAVAPKGPGNHRRLDVTHFIEVLDIDTLIDGPTLRPERSSVEITAAHRDLFELTILHQTQRRRDIAFACARSPSSMMITLLTWCDWQTKFAWVAVTKSMKPRPLPL